jgi:hypothetical protein
VEKLAELKRLQMTKRCMRFACLITKATNTHSEYAILITFPWQQLKTVITSNIPTYCPQPANKTHFTNNESD